MGAPRLPLGLARASTPPRCPWVAFMAPPRPALARATGTEAVPRLTRAQRGGWRRRHRGRAWPSTLCTPPWGTLASGASHVLIVPMRAAASRAERAHLECHAAALAISATSGRRADRDGPTPSPRFPNAATAFHASTPLAAVSNVGRDLGPLHLRPAAFVGLHLQAPRPSMKVALHRKLALAAVDAHCRDLARRHGRVARTAAPAIVLVRVRLGSE
mmetsp:Transcript_22141/g.59729  ORF Transcript_22141/g.59729 Transcript_22141/m.59729 type:complete len:216 (-) Transcript_22141:933-1580(-)